ncbi:MAG: sulfotransferase domain-containing protein [Bacteroidota bacterium]
MSKKIDLMIIGAQKAGTTALKNYLNEHPQITGHPQTEFSFLKENEEYEKGFDFAFSKYFNSPTYKDSNKIIAKYVSIYYEEELLQRLAKHNPACKLVFIIREPVARAYSAYCMEQFNGWLNRDSHEMIDVIKKQQYQDTMYRLFINMGLYDEHIELIYKYFPKEQVKIVLYENLNKNSLGTCKEIFEWMGVDASFSPNVEKKYNETKTAKSDKLTKLITSLKSDKNKLKIIAKKILPYSLFTKIGNSIVEYNKSSKKHKPISNELFTFLHQFYKPHNDKFTALTGIDISHWNK